MSTPGCGRWALPTDLVDYRLQITYPTTDGTYCPHRRRRLPFLPTSARWTFICSPRAATSGCGRILGAHPARSPPPTVRSTCRSRCGRRNKGVSLIGELGNWDGSDAPMRVLGSPASGSCSGRASPRGPVQVPGARRRRRGHRPGRPDGLRHRVPPHRLPGVRLALLVE